MKRSIKEKRFFVISLMTAILALTGLSVAYAEEEKPMVEIAVTASSGYVWRGYELSRNGIAVQPSMTVGYQGFSANFWGNLDTKPYCAGTETGKTYSSTWNETDVTLSYTKEMESFSVGAGYIYYGLGALNPDAAKRLDSQELFLSVGLNTILAPTLTVYKDIGHYHAWYFLLGISHEIALNQMVSLNITATAGYLLSTDASAYPKFDENARATGDKFSNFHDGALAVSLPIKATSYITLTPTISYIFALSDDAKNEMKGLGLKGTASPAERDSSFMVGTLTVSLAF
ncbi:MAG: hypothetical protein JXA41_00815 [Deltaproteobacteria bacterium]|nr:hypothetical protein [Deltaproteobacteria bacterium]